MAKLNADEQRLLEELQARAAAPDEDDQFEVEIYDTTAGKGARVPFSQAKGWLHEIFGIGQAPGAAGAAEGAPAGGAPPAGGAGEGGAGSGGGKAPPPSGSGYFGSRG